MEATLEQHQAVARDQCRVSGHAIEGVFELGSLAPKLVICGHCSAEWRIHPDDINEDFGRR